MAKSKIKSSPEDLDNYKVLREQIAELNKKRDELEKKQKNICKDFFATLCEEFFKQNEDVRSFEWQQYTPYFNDGEPCTFRANHEYCKINAICAEDGEDADQEDVFSSDGKELKWDSKEYNKLRKSVSGFMSNFSKNDLECWFGDHVTVKVTRDGVETEEYEHD